MAWSSSGLGHRPLKAKIGGSNPLQATTVIFCEPFEAGYQLGRFVFFYCNGYLDPAKNVSDFRR